MKALVLINTFATLIMVGVIWVMQIVHYPLFAWVGKEQFVAYELQHIDRITLIVLPIMLIEATTALLLVFNMPSSTPPMFIWAGLGLVSVIWVSTFIFQDIQHGSLARGYDLEVINSLVNSNWIRTVAWSIRAGIMAVVTYRMMG